MLDIASYTDIGGRARNEDTVRYITRGEDALCLVLADGLGGHGGGELASAAAAECICQGWCGTADADTLENLVREANRRVLAIQTPQCAMKTTVTVLILAGKRAVWSHAGDSRLYYFRDGTLDFQTRDHSAAQLGVLLGDITPDQIRFHEDRSRVLRALGQDDELTVETGERELGGGTHAFLLCSDGFWEYVLEPEMEEDLAKAAGPEDWLERMRRRLKKRVPEDNDNNTAAAVWVNERQEETR